MSSPVDSAPRFRADAGDNSSGFPHFMPLPEGEEALSSPLAFPVFTPTDVLASRRHYVVTPLEASIVPLVKGSLPVALWERVVQNWESTAEDPRSMTLSSIGERTVSDALCLRIQRVAVSIVKIYQQEPRSARRMEASPNETSPRKGCPPGVGAFTELLVSLYIRRNLTKIEELADWCIIPGIGYAQMGHHAFVESFANRGKIQAALLPPSIRGTGTIQEFIEDSFTSSLEELNQMPPLALEFMVVMQVITLNSDGSFPNVLIQRKAASRAIVLIDQAYTLSSAAADGVKSCALDCEALQGPPSERIKRFIAELDEGELEMLNEQISCELLRNLELLPADRRQGENKSIGRDRMLPHQIAIAFVQEAVLSQGWSLSRVGRAAQAGQTKREECWTGGGILHTLYQQLKDCPPDQMRAKIQEFCQPTT